MDEDLAGMSPERLIEEVRRLRQGIREHRDSGPATERPAHDAALRGAMIDGMACD